MKWDESASAAANARLKLPAQAAKYFRAGRKLAGAKFAYPAFHRFRLRTKRFRYTLEFFRFCYGPALDELLADLRRIQDCLGAISDCETARLLAGDKAFERYLRTRAERKARQFQRHWRKALDPAEVRWSRYLARPRRGNPSPRPKNLRNN